MSRATAKEDASVEIAPCILGGTGAGVQFSIPAGGAALVRNVGAAFSSCTDEAFYLVDAPDVVDVQSIIRFADDTSHASFIVGAIGAITPTSTTRVGPLVSDAEEGAWITVFPTHEGPVSIRLLDATGHAPDVSETFWATPPVTQYRVEAQGLFMGDVSIGGDFGCLPYSCADVGPIYGFASSGTPDGGTFRSFPFTGSFTERSRSRLSTPK